MFNNVKEDLRMYIPRDQKYDIKKLIHLFFAQEFQAVLIFRFGHWVKYETNIPIISNILKLIYFFLRKISGIFCAIEIWPESEVGPGLRIEHYGGVLILGKIGKNCRISQQVTIGHIGGFKGGGYPTIGDNVYIGAGAKILGKINIGNNVKIGANAVVIRDVPDNAIAVGVPAQIKWPKNHQK